MLLLVVFSGILFSCINIRSVSKTINESYQKKWFLLNQESSLSNSYIQFDSDSTWSGLCVCNFIKGQYKIVDNNRIEFQTQFMTYKGCENQVLQAYFLESLKRQYYIKEDIKTNQIKLVSTQDKYVFLRN